MEPDSSITTTDLAPWRRHPLVAGLVGGVLWGAVLRLWMASLVRQPEFTWEGTGIVLAFAAVVGSTIGAAHANAAKDRRWAVRLSGVGALAFGPSPGAIIVPGIVLGGLAFARTSWPSWVRALLAVVGLAPAAVIPAFMDDLGIGRAILSVVWYCVLVAIAARASRVVYEPSPARVEVLVPA